MYRIFLIAFVVLASCSDSKTSNTKIDSLNNDTSLTDDTNISTTPIQWGGCYGWAENKDTAMLELQVSDTIVSGKLTYDWNEKDRNTGTLTGIFRDSVIHASYTFQSEGMTSTREVVFKVKGDSLVEGFGDIDTSGDTVKFKNSAALQFQTDRPFAKMNCP